MAHQLIADGVLWPSIQHSRGVASPEMWLRREDIILLLNLKKFETGYAEYVNILAADGRVGWLSTHTLNLTGY